MKELREYLDKRNFSETPEPEATAWEPEETNRFVIQKHMARREHYDFRLQVGSVLVSWAIPKQPVDDPEIKRLAIKVEDHPLSYIHFEGTIPEGNYGAGTVMVWDLGYYYLDEEKHIPSDEEVMQKIKKGHLKLYLQGAKLKGPYNLVEHQGSQNNEWFFMKARHTAASDDFDSKSALTGRSMEEIAGSAAPEVAAGEARRPRRKKDTASAPKSEFPGFIEPMLATLADEPFAGGNWIFELKLDGYRVIAAKNGETTQLFSRRDNSLTENYAGIAAELSGLPANFVIDGEVCYMESGQKADFQKLQRYDRGQEHLHYYAFDILWLNGHNLQTVPLIERKKILQLLLAEPPPHIHYLEHIENDGIAFFEEVKKKRGEGMIAKRADSPYSPGLRSKDWFKVKTGYWQEMVVCGYIPSEKGARPFSSLLCAVYETGSLVYTGRVGTGFSEEMMEDLMPKLRDLEIDRLTIENAPAEKNIRWLRPRLICEVKFSNWTNDGIMRHASFVGLRTDKKPEDIHFEQAVKPVIPTGRVKFTNLDKLFWPEEGYTKEDVIAYYRDVAEVILPYLKDRPQSLYRTPSGIIEKGFFQKNVSEIAPDWAETVELTNSDGEKIEYLLCQDEDTLLYMANLGCIEINPWSSSLPQLENPDFMIFDLDPVDVDMSDVVRLAFDFKRLFDQLGIPAYCKTSGSRGLHLYVPVRRCYTYSQVQNFVKLIETYIHSQNPEITSLERSPAARKGKIYLDYLQNAKGKTMASVYSIRPRLGAPVSAPLSWDELHTGLDPRKFTLRTMRRRLERKGDLWHNIFKQRVDMQKVLNTLKDQET
ncbi:MAG TPA: DNA ligase D [Desulfobulbaceae bacterium]|nr:DNA ligase D [Desulfobulbaceae bacterium]